MFSLLAGTLIRFGALGGSEVQPALHFPSLVWETVVFPAQ